MGISNYFIACYCQCHGPLVNIIGFYISHNIQLASFIANAHVFQHAKAGDIYTTLFNVISLYRAMLVASFITNACAVGNYTYSPDKTTTDTAFYLMNRMVRISHLFTNAFLEISFTCARETSTYCTRDTMSQKYAGFI